MNTFQVYVDGSWNPSNPDLAGWAFIIVRDNIIIDEGSGVIKCLSRQIDGELFSTIKALEALKDLSKVFKVNSVEIFYDYMGIEAWYSGKWKAKSQVAKDYVDRLKYFSEVLSKVQFVKVKSHAGVSEGNDLVDKMAKDALKN